MDEREAHRAFRALLLAHAYPGRAQPGPASRAEDALRMLEEAVWVDAPRPPLVIGTEDATPILAAATRGTELEPELGATVVRVVDGRGLRLRVVLEGPGVNGTCETSIPLTPGELAARDEACASYPLGIDLVFVEADGRVAALPRTARITPVGR